MTYLEFVEGKRHSTAMHGFRPIVIPSCLFDFQSALVEWALMKGRAAIFADCGLGKTPMQLVWAENVVRHTAKPVLVILPLGVAAQTISEAEKFHIDAVRSKDGFFPQGSRVVVTNYERLHYFDPNKFSGAVCDESSILKNFDGKTKAAITEFMRKLPYRLLCTATAAPNDYIELGTSSEALGELGFMDMLNRFFKKEGPTLSRSDELRYGVWRFRGHAERDFWRWVCSWSRAVRKPSDLGFDDGRFVLPELETREHVVSARTKPEGFLFDLPATNLQEQREERRRTIQERCEMAAQLASHKRPSILWCHLNDEGDLLERLTPGAIQVAGSDSDEFKEEAFESFVAGRITKLVTKPSIAALGLNFQHCAHQTFFPSHSFEQYYQAVRRSWRFGQKNKVRIDMISSEGESGVLANLRRKSEAANRMFAELVSLMSQELRIARKTTETNAPILPSWIQPLK